MKETLYSKCTGRVEQHLRDCLTLLLRNSVKTVPMRFLVTFLPVPVFIHQKKRFPDLTDALFIRSVLNFKPIYIMWGGQAHHGSPVQMSQLSY
jgi:hypothetical protein